MKYIILALFMTLFISCNSSQAQAYKNVGVDEFKTLMTKDNTVILDVRTPGETAEGIISGAQEIDYKADGFDKKIDKLDKSKTYLVYCKSGGRSSRSAKMMMEKGFKDVYNLEGGYTAWSK